MTEIVASIAIVILLCAINVNSQEKKSADLWLGGDVHLGDGGREQLQGISGIVQGAAGIVNLEGPVAERDALRSTGLRLWNSPRALNEISALNVKVAGIANNHARDAGPASQRHTADHLREHSILPTGGTAGVAIVELDGLVIAVTAHDLTHGVPANLATELESAKRQAVIGGVVRPVDALIATFHVTGPPSYLPRPELKRAVEIAYRTGALVIAAHGTHAVGPVERRGQTVIAWGLGNLAFACDCTNESDAILLRVKLEPHRVVAAEVVPVKAGINNGRASPSNDAAGIFDLLEAIGSSKLERREDRATF